MSSHGSTGTGQEGPAHWTVRIMPDRGGRIRTVRVARRVVRLAVVAAFTFGLVIAAFVVSLGLDGAREAELVRLLPLIRFPMMEDTPLLMMVVAQQPLGMRLLAETHQSFAKISAGGGLPAAASTGGAAAGWRAGAANAGFHPV